MKMKFDDQKYTAIMNMYQDYLRRAVPLNLPHYMTIHVFPSTITLTVFRFGEVVEIVGSMMRFSIDGSGVWDGGQCDLDVIQSLMTHLLEPTIDDWTIQRMTRPVEEVFPF